VWGIHDDQPIHKSKPVPEIIDLSWFIHIYPI
jgi:hypothetical protein